MMKIIKEKKISRDSIWVLIQIVIFYRMILNLLYSTEHPFQTQKDMYFAIASAWLVVTVFLLREISLSKKVVWITMGSAIAIMSIYFFLKKIIPARYGPDYFKIIVIYWLISITFIALLVDFIFSEAMPETIRSNWKMLVPILIVGVIVAVYDGLDAIPIFCPIVSLLLTRVSKKQWVNFINCFAIGYYMAFAQTMTKSLIQNPDRYQDGRYLGSFMELESGGMFCGGAVLCMLYFVIHFFVENEKRWYKLALPLILAVYPIYAVLRITSRSTQLAIFLVLLFIFVFVHRKGKKTTYCRLAIALAACAVVSLSAFAVSSRLTKSIENGEKPSLSYWEAHLTNLTSDKGRTGYFKDGSILNALDKLASKRLCIWVESTKQIGLIGHTFEAFDNLENVPVVTSPHNFFILWLIEYGLIGGGLVVVWFCCNGVLYIKKVQNHESDLILPFLWWVFCIGIFTFSCVRWQSPISYGLLLCQYGLMRMHGKENVSNE